MRIQVFFTTSFLLCLCLCLCGCKKGKPLYPVKATIQLDGAPLASGTLYFYPLSGTPPAGGNFKDGVLDFLAPPGKAKVEIKSLRNRPPEQIPAKFKGMEGQYDMRIQILPDRYNRKTELTAEVTPDGPNEFTFDLKSK